MRKVSVYLDDDLWHRMRVGCVERQVSASAEISRLVTNLLRQWEREGPQAFLAYRRTSSPEEHHHD
jgi:hypothetical protein